MKLPEPAAQQRSAYVFAFHKSGSTLIQDMLHAYCKGVGVPAFSLFDEAFRQGVSTNQIDKDAAHCFKPHGYIYTGFRHYPNFPLDLKDVPAVLLVRDPRDMLVSLYHSIRTSHKVPSGNTRLQRQRHKASSMDIDEHVLMRHGMYRNAFNRYREALIGSDIAVYRYEDVIYTKAHWLSQLIEKLALPLDPGLVKTVAARVDVFPEKEDESKHIRQVHPGNYKSSLKMDTIKQLNNHLAEFIEHFGYEK